MNSFPLIIISGPTATGKTSFSIKIAKEINAEIINLDSVQMYAKCDIGSAKPTIEEREGVPHHLFDIFHPNEKNNAAKFLEYAEQAIQDIRSRKKNVIACGGTMLYLKALLYGLADLPKGDTAIRNELEELSTQDLYEKLIQYDVNSAKKLHPNDRTRIIRALEVYLISGLEASKLQESHAFQQPKFNALILVPCYPRDVLYKRIDERSKLILEMGLIQETQQIINEYGKNAPVLDTVGYKEAKNYILGNISKDELLPAISQATRQLAKRQLTFWRNEPKKRDWKIVSNLANDNNLLLSEMSSPQSKRTIQKDIVPTKLSMNEILLMTTEHLHSGSEPEIKISFFSF